jgi:outer membrane protein insertion porin family
VVFRVAVIIALVCAASAAYADDPPAPPQPAPSEPTPPPPAVAPALASTEPKPVVGFRVRGKSKVTEVTLARLAHMDLGDRITPARIPSIEAALVSSELFEKVKVTLEDAPGGVLVVATVRDKISWIIAPTVYVLPSNKAAGVGYAENNLFGEEKKLLLYGQLGNHQSLFFGTYLDPAVRGSQLITRLDVYLLQLTAPEYLNPPDNARDFTIGRESTQVWLDGGALVGWRFYWWLIADLRLRAAYTYYKDSHAPDGTPMPDPDKDGWDVSLQPRVTLDKRRHAYGVTWGPFLQMMFDQAIPGVDDWGYSSILLRGYYSWKFLGEHELELRTNLQMGRKLPFHEEMLNGGVIDLRGYDVAQFRGDTRATVRAEYSVPLFKWRIFAFRALGFYDGGYIGFHFTDHSASNTRNYLPTQVDGAHWLRNDVGAGLRVYLKNIVLPLLGLDFGYGIEGHSPEVYFEVGLTDF